MLGEHNNQYKLENITQDNLIKLKRINSLLFPVSYSPLFYKLVLSSGELAKLCYYQDRCVGAICCRLDDSSIDDKLKPGEYSVYLMTLGLLAPYRKLGLGQALLEHIINYTKSQNYKRIYLHVQISNLEAIEFYKKFGFQIQCEVKDYYKNIEPAHAFLLEKLI